MTYQRKYTHCIVCGEEIKIGKYCKKCRKKAIKIRNKNYYRRWYKMNGHTWRKKYPEKAATHSIVAMAIAKGNLKKPIQCKWCGSHRRLQAHHKNYKQPLKVIWLCAFCHRQEHSRLKKVI